MGLASYLLDQEIGSRTRNFLSFFPIHAYRTVFLDGFCIDCSKPVMIAGDQFYQSTMGSNEMMAFVDLYRINKLYNCLSTSMLVDISVIAPDRWEASYDAQAYLCPKDL
jgi:hypothetical protein